MVIVSGYSIGLSKVWSKLKTAAKIQEKILSLNIKVCVNLHRHKIIKCWVSNSDACVQLICNKIIGVFTI